MVLQTLRREWTRTERRCQPTAAENRRLKEQDTEIETRYQMAISSMRETEIRNQILQKRLDDIGEEGDTSFGLNNSIIGPEIAELRTQGEQFKAQVVYQAEDTSNKGAKRKRGDDGGSHNLNLNENIESLYDKFNLNINQRLLINKKKI